MVELGIVDIREIIRIIKKTHDIDFSVFALTSFKYNLEKVMNLNTIHSTDGLIRKLTEDPDFLDLFLNDLFTPSTEMFRDPSLWRWLREEYFPKLPERHFDNFKIWFPQNVSGAELFTMCILLQEIDLLQKVKIYATVYSNKSLEYIKSGSYPLKKLEVSIENYKRFQGSEDFEKYYTMKNHEAIRDTSLISNVEFIKDNINLNKTLQNVKLIMYRNVMIYLNPSRQNEMLDKMQSCLSAAGNLIIGTKEVTRTSNASALKFDIVNEGEGVYKKKI
ncbi:MAG: hypothetical protein JXA77_02470 [Bacteroidales bacterium]|nr:hypothetical protein [Bacteroidales bacterium]MBN2817804.1 hypothetical protein [Bacteroidales bacterium]